MTNTEMERRLLRIENHLGLHETPENLAEEARNLDIFTRWAQQDGDMWMWEKPNDRTYGFDAALMKGRNSQVLAIVEFTGRGSSARMDDSNGQGWDRGSAKTEKGLLYSFVYKIPYHALYCWDRSRLYLSKPLPLGLEVCWGGRNGRSSANDKEIMSTVPSEWFTLIAVDGKLMKYFRWLPLLRP